MLGRIFYQGCVMMPKTRLVGKNIISNCGKIRQTPGEGGMYRPWLKKRHKGRKDRRDWGNRRWTLSSSNASQRIKS